MTRLRKAFMRMWSFVASILLWTTLAVLAFRAIGLFAGVAWLPFTAMGAVAVVGIWLGAGLFAAAFFTCTGGYDE